MLIFPGVTSEKNRRWTALLPMLLWRRKTSFRCERNEVDEVRCRGGEIEYFPSLSGILAVILALMGIDFLVRYSLWNV